MNSYKIAVGRSGTKVVKNKEVSWDTLKEKLTNHVLYDDKEHAPLFSGCSFRNDRRLEENIIEHSLLTIDIDKHAGTLTDIEFNLEMNIDCAFIAYSTFSHKTDRPCVRVIVPLSKTITPNQYRVVSRSFCENLGLKVDKIGRAHV